MNRYQQELLQSNQDQQIPASGEVGSSEGITTLPAGSVLYEVRCNLFLSPCLLFFSHFFLSFRSVLNHHHISIVLILQI
jgi:hypothetical protein